MKRSPVVIFTLVLVCVLLHVAIPETSKALYLTSPSQVLSLSGLAWGKAILAGFLHVNFSHLFGNCLLLVLLGYPVELSLGSRKTLYLLLCAGIGSLVFHIGTFPTSSVPFLGASGYAFGILTAWVFLLNRQINLGYKVLPAGFLP